MVAEYHQFNTGSLSFEFPESWDTHAASTVNQRVIFIFWEPPPSGFVNVNFDGSVWGAKKGSRNVIEDLNGRLPTAKGSYLFKPSIPEAKLRAT